LLTSHKVLQDFAQSPISLRTMFLIPILDMATAGVWLRTKYRKTSHKVNYHFAQSILSVNSYWLLLATNV